MNEKIKKKPLVVFFDAVGTVLKPAIPVEETYHLHGARHGSKISRDEIKPLFHKAFKKEEAKDDNMNCQTNEAREQERWKNIVQACFPDLKNHETCFRDLFNYYSNPEAWDLCPGTIPAINFLQSNGINWGIASNFDQRLKRIVLKKTELVNCKWLIISSLIGHKKPSRHFFEQLQSSSGHSFKNILMVGDTPENDIHPAARLGMQTFLVGKGQSLGNLVQFLGR